MAQVLFSFDSRWAKVGQYIYSSIVRVSLYWLALSVPHAGWTAASPGLGAVLCEAVFSYSPVLIKALKYKCNALEWLGNIY